MTRKLLSLAVASALAARRGPRARARARAERRIEALKAQLAALSAKIEQLEKVADADQEDRRRGAGHRRPHRGRGRAGKSRASPSAATCVTAMRSFDVEYVDRDRKRDRVRARLNASYRVNDTLTGVIGIATGGPDPRSSNQTLTDQNSRKDFELDLAYVTWAPNADWQVHARQAALFLAAQPAACSTTATSIPKASRSTTRRAISSPARSTTGSPNARCPSAT